MKENYFDNLKIDIKELYKKYPINFKVNPKPNQFNFANNVYSKIYKNPLIPLKLRNKLWLFFRKNSLDNSWLDEFNNYWTKILKGRPLPTIYDMFFIKNIYRLKFQESIIPDTYDSYEHLEAWQRPEVIFQLLHLVCKSVYYNESRILNFLKKKKKDFKSFLEFGCATAPITTSFFEFSRKPKVIKISISDIQTLAFHYASYKFKRCSNIRSILLTPENDFLLELDEKFDVIFCMTVFEHLNKPLKTIKAFDKILNHQGLLFFDYIISSGDGLNTHHGYRERDSVLDYINDNFKLIYGRINKEKNMGLTIVEKT